MITIIKKNSSKISYNKADLDVGVILRKQKKNYKLPPPILHFCFPDNLPPGRREKEMDSALRKDRYFGKNFYKYTKREDL